jgi:hypothetical protein
LKALVSAFEQRAGLRTTRFEDFVTGLNHTRA